MPNAIVPIADQAHIEADIHGKRVHIRGTMRGTISAAEHVEMAASLATRPRQNRSAIADAYSGDLLGTRVAGPLSARLRSCTRPQPPYEKWSAR